MILVDASVIIGFWRQSTPAVRRLLGQRGLGMCGITVAEMLRGARTPDERERLERMMASFVPVETPELIWPMLGEHLRRLREARKSLPFQDVVLATVAIFHEMEIWTNDEHFGEMKDVLEKLRLFPRPI